MLVRLRSSGAASRSLPSARQPAWGEYRPVANITMPRLPAAVIACPKGRSNLWFRLSGEIASETSSPRNDYSAGLIAMAPSIASAVPPDRSYAVTASWQFLSLHRISYSESPLLSEFTKEKQVTDSRLG
jgi:hypothetical protein